MPRGKGAQERGVPAVDPAKAGRRGPRGVLRLAAAAAAAFVTACGGDDGGSDAAGCRAAEDRSVTIVAKDIEWDASCLEASAGEPLTIVVDNQDDGVAHNLSLDAPGDPETELETGPATQELEVSLDAGSYDFVCEIHPNMVGTLRMVEAS